MNRWWVGMFVVGMFVLGTIGRAQSHEGEEHKSHKAVTGAVKGHEHAHEHAADTEDPDVTLQGEVLDLACYMPHLGQGKKHQECALTCLQNGAPAGLLTKDGKVYLLMPDHSQEKAFEPVKKLAGEMATVTGHLAKRGGLQALSVEKIEKVK